MGVLVQRKDGTYRLHGDISESLLVNANSFLEACECRGLSPASVRAYGYDLVLLFRWLESSGHLFEELSQASLLEYISFQQQLDAQPRSINRRLTTCVTFYRFVTGSELRAAPHSTSPASHYKGRGRDHALGLHRLHKSSRLQLRVKVPHRLVEPLHAEQVKTFIRTLKRYRDLAITYLLLFCGLRSGEVLSLRLADFDEEDRRLRVLGKGNRERALPLPNLLLSVVADYLRLERPADAATCRLLVILQGPRRGHPMTPAGLRSLFRHRRSTRALLSNANAHRFRHTFGADMARTGVRLPILQRMLGHADAKTTLLYINLSMEDVAVEYNRAIASIERRYDGEGS